MVPILYFFYIRQAKCYEILHNSVLMCETEAETRPHIELSLGLVSFLNVGSRSQSCFRHSMSGVGLEISCLLATILNDCIRFCIIYYCLIC